MKPMIKLLVAGLWFYAVILGTAPESLAAAQYPDGTDKLKGTWQCRGAAGQTLLKISSQNVFDYDGQQLPFTLVPGAIRVQGPYGPVNYYYVFHGDSLVIAFPDGARISCGKLPGGQGR